jgi:putative redox protein
MSDITLVTARSDAAAYHVVIGDGRHEWAADTVPGNGGADSGPDPESLVLGALGACTAITLRMFAARKQWPLQGVEVQLRYSRRDAGGTAIERSIQLQGELDDTQRQKLLEIAEKCPIHRLLTGEVSIATGLAE